MVVYMYIYNMCIFYVYMLCIYCIYIIINLLLKIFTFYLFLAHWSFVVVWELPLVVESGDYAAVCELLIAVASLVTENGL